MKKILFFLFGLMISISATSQITSGVKAGVVLSNLSGFEADGAGLDSAIASRIEDGRMGYFAGFFVGIPLTPKITFQPEFQYVQQGSDADELRIDYLQIPLALDYKFSEKFFGSLGPQFGIRVWTPGDSGLIDTFDYSVFGTLGYIIKDSFFIEARYSVGVNDIPTGNAIPLNLDQGDLTRPTFSNSYFYIGIGYRL